MQIDTRIKKWYADRGGYICPFCLSKNLTHAEKFTITKNKELRLNTKCTNCNTEWVDVYILLKMEDLPVD